MVAALLDREELAPGDRAYVQMRSAGWIVACPGDRFVLRAFSPAVTLGGGAVLDQRPRRHKGRRSETIDRLEVLAGGAPADRLAAFLENRGLSGLDPMAVQATLGVPLEEARNLLQGAVRSGVAFVTDRKAQRHHLAAIIAELEDKALALLTKFHAEFPLKRGLGVEELRTKFPRYIDTKLVEFVLTRLEDQDRIVVEGDILRRSDFTLQLSRDDEDLRERILDALRERAYEAPSLHDAAVALGEDPESLRPVLDYLVGEGVLTRTKEGFFFETRRLEDLVRRVIDLLREKGEIGVADIKRITGTTRKYTIPLLEYLDNKKITARRGDMRVAGPKGRA